LGDWAQRELGLLAKEREQARVDRICLGEDAHAFPKLADATRVDDHDRQARLGELQHQIAFVASCRLDHDAARALRN